MTVPAPTTTVGPTVRTVGRTDATDGKTSDPGRKTFGTAARMSDPPPTAPPSVETAGKTGATGVTDRVGPDDTTSGEPQPPNRARTAST